MRCPFRRPRPLLGSAESRGNFGVSHCASGFCLRLRLSFWSPLLSARRSGSRATTAFRRGQKSRPTQRRPKRPNRETRRRKAAVRPRRRVQRRPSTQIPIPAPKCATKPSRNREPFNHRPRQRRGHPRALQSVSPRRRSCPLYRLPQARRKRRHQLRLPYRKQMRPSRPASPVMGPTGIRKHPRSPRLRLSPVHL